jgi:hypothetical protein
MSVNGHAYVDPAALLEAWGRLTASLLIGAAAGGAYDECLASLLDSLEKFPRQGLDNSDTTTLAAVAGDYALEARQILRDL